jgi:putative membrane protein
MAVRFASASICYLLEPAMPSELRLHPTTLLFELAKHAKRFALPALLVLVGMSRSTGGPGGNFGRLPSGWEVWLLVPFVPAVVLSITRYLSFRLRYEDKELVIRSGILFRNERHIPYSRIQNVDAIQNLFHRFFGVVEVRVETGGGKEEEARLSVLPKAAFEEMRRRVFVGRSLTTDSADSAAESVRRGGTLVPPSDALTEETPRGETLVHLPLRELLLCGFLENKGMVLIAGVFGVAWESGVMGRLSEILFERAGVTSGRGFFRNLVRSSFEDGQLPWGRLGIALAGFIVFLLVVRVISMVWALVRLYDFRLTRVGEDLRSEYGLFTKVAATIPIRRVQTITFSTGPLHRWLGRATVRVATAGGGGQRQGNKSSRQGRERLAPLIRREALPHLLQQVVPGFDLAAVEWQPVHPRAFARAVKPMLVFIALITLALALLIGWAAIGAAILMLIWSIIGTRKHVAHLGWAEGDEVVMLRSGWIWQQTTLARVNKIQAVTMYESPFDRRAAMSGVRVDTAGAGDLSHRVDIPYLDQLVARSLAGRLAASAANTAFRW